MTFVVLSRRIECCGGNLTHETPHRNHTGNVTTITSNTFQHAQSRRGGAGLCECADAARRKTGVLKTGGAALRKY